MFVVFVALLFVVDAVVYALVFVCKAPDKLVLQFYTLTMPFDTLTKAFYTLLSSLDVVLS